jgi:hypothetical protein
LLLGYFVLEVAAADFEAVAFARQQEEGDACKPGNGEDSFHGGGHWRTVEFGEKVEKKQREIKMLGAKRKAAFWAKNG